MPILRYKTNIKNQKIADKFLLHLQQKMADFVIRFELEQDDYILTLKGNRDVSHLVWQALTKEDIQYHLLTPENKPYDV